MKHAIFQKLVSRNKGKYEGQDMCISTDGMIWKTYKKLWITSIGNLVCSDTGYSSNDGEVILNALQSCYVQILATMQNHKSITRKTSNRSLMSRRSIVSMNQREGENNETPPVLFIRTYENERLYIKVPTKQEFVELVSSLLVWQGLKSKGLSKKWYCCTKIDPKYLNEEVHELLVCRFKVFGPIPSKKKNLKIVPGIRAPLSLMSENGIVDSSAGDSHSSYSSGEHIEEGWFYTMGVLKSNGILNLIAELDGQILYSIDVKLLLSSEVRQVHHSIFENNNILFLGRIEDLRWNNRSKLTSPFKMTHDVNFISKDGRSIPSHNRIYIEFPLHIDLEDWFVGLTYFARKEYIGTAGFGTSLAQKIGYLDNEEVNGAIDPESDYMAKEDYLRVSKKIMIDIVEAKFSQELLLGTEWMYAEIVMWGYPCGRTASVPISQNPFWKEQFEIDLPISSQMVNILLKSSKNKGCSTTDRTIANVYLTPDVLAKHVNISSSTIVTTESNSPELLNVETKMNGSNAYLEDLTIYDSNNIPIGKLCLDVKLSEFHILPSLHYKSFGSMLTNAPMKDLIAFCNKRNSKHDIESMSSIMLDAFQSVGVEEEWFKAMMEIELADINIASRRNYSKRVTKNPAEKSTISNNIFNTLFRGQSLFSKSLEIYNARVGQEYLEKVFKEFFEKIASESKDCETDSRTIKKSIIFDKKKNSHSKKLSIGSMDTIGSDEFDSEEEFNIDQTVKEIAEQNLETLQKYFNELWSRIYTTSNDMPQMIKTQLKNFRTKVELSCDPEDTKTPLNCLSAFIFLRFFCPAILNPKLFGLSKTHQTGSIQRTHTLLAKVLLNFANMQPFLEHKEPHLMKLNHFLEDHKDELMDYYDKITGRKNDFTEKILEMSNEMTRFDLGLAENESSSELPSTPYLMDKYLKFTELVYLLDGEVSGSNSTQSIGLGSLTREDYTPSEPLMNLNLNSERNVYQIGSLEFEKSEFLELAGEDDTEGFIRSLCGDNENIFSFITSNVTLADLRKQARLISRKIHELEAYMEGYEYPANYSSDWEQFSDELISKAYFDTSTNTLVHLDTMDVDSAPFLRRITENSFNSLKLKFSDSNLPAPTIASSLSTNSLGSVFKTTSKNPLRKLFRK